DAHDTWASVSIEIGKPPPASPPDQSLPPHPLPPHPLGLAPGWRLSLRPVGPLHPPPPRLGTVMLARPMLVRSAMFEAPTAIAAARPSTAAIASRILERATVVQPAATVASPIAQSAPAGVFHLNRPESVTINPSMMQFRNVLAVRDIDVAS